jgi:peptide/nickel transport system permease protein
MRYYITKAAQMSTTFLIVIHLSFVLMQLLPGGPARYLRAQLLAQGIGEGGMSVSEVNRLVEAYLNVNPDQSLINRYLSYMSSLLQGDLGTSLWLQRSVSSIYLEAIPWTIFLMGTSIVLSYIIGVLLGAFMAYKEGGWFDTSFTSISIVLMSIPFYLFGVIVIYYFAVRNEFFPFSGRYSEGLSPELTIEFIRNALYHGILPITSVVITTFGLVAIAMRGNSISVLGEDYMRVAKLRGLSDRVISVRYVGRNAILPLYTRFMIAMGTLFGGSVILEELFLYKGMGYYLFLGINSRDYPLVMGGFIIITVTVLAGIFVAELTYGYIDPRAGRDSHE